MTARTASRGTARDRRPAHDRRSGFTLLEILAVVTIIAILIALLLPAMNAVIVRARLAGVKADMASIHTAIASFKTQYGTEPPSYVSFRKQDNDKNPTTPPPAAAGIGDLDPATRGILRKMFPQISFDAALQAALVKAGLWNKELRGSEALVFFLGGVRKVAGASPTVAETELVGFSKNPANPFAQPAAGQSNRIPPMLEFDSSRLVDTDADGLLEYKDKFPGQSKPFLYGSTAATGSYRNTDVEGVPAGWTFYRKGTAANATYWNPNSYQLVSPGPDGDYGKGGGYDPNGTSSLDAKDADNLTNFAEGRLGG